MVEINEDLLMLVVAGPALVLSLFGFAIGWVEGKHVNEEPWWTPIVGLVWFFGTLVAVVAVIIAIVSGFVAGVS